MAPLHSIVVPVYNEIQGVQALFERLRAVADQVPGQCEVILVNDGSSDGTAEKLNAIHEQDPRFRVLHFSRNFGHQVAITAGMEHAGGDTVSVIDADLQDPPELILEFIRQWQSGFEVVYGVRRERAGENFFKLWTASLFYRVIRWVTQLDLPVNAGDFRLLDRKVVDALMALPERNRYVRGLVTWVGFKQTGVPYDRASRFAGTTHYPFHKMLKLAFDGISSFSLFPLRLATYLGFLSAIGAMMAATWVCYLKFFTDRTIPGWTSLALIVLALETVHLISIGILGEYVGRSFDEARRRPLYLVAHKVGFESAKQLDRAA